MNDENHRCLHKCPLVSCDVATLIKPRPPHDIRPAKYLTNPILDPVGNNKQIYASAVV